MPKAARRLLTALLVLVFVAGGVVAANRPIAARFEDEILWCWPRADDGVRQDFGGSAPAFTFPATNLVIVVELALGADLTADPGTWTWTDITQYVRLADRIVIHRGRGDEWAEVGPSQAALTLDNSDGRFTRVNVFGAWYGQLRRNTPLRIRVDMHTGAGPQTRFTGYVTKWPPRWDRSGNNRYAPITADGIFRRLGQGDPLRSAMFRSIVTTNTKTPFAYWTLEQDAVIPASALPDSADGPRASAYTPYVPAGGPMIRVRLDLPDIEVGTDSTLLGAGTVAKFSYGIAGIVAAPAYADAGKWTIQMAARLYPPITTSQSIPLGADMGEFGYAVWLYPQSDTIRLTVFDLATSSSLFDVSADLDGTAVMADWISVTLQSEANSSGSTDRVTAYVRDHTGALLGSVTTLTGATTHGQLTKLNVVMQHLGTNGISVGHLAVYDQTDFTLGVDDLPHARSMHGWSGEQAHERIRRLCAEEQVPADVTGTESITMGPQGIATLLDLLRDAESTDLGVLLETLGGCIGYRTNRDRYSRGPLLTLDYDQGQIQDPWSPEDDDQKLHNDVTVSRPGGSSAHLDDPDSISREGRYKLPHTANTETDDQLAQVAGWLRHMGTWDELRFPQVGFKLHRHTSLIPYWLAQDLLTQQAGIINLPDPVPPTTVQSIEGYDETIGSVDWDVTLNLAPAGPFTIAKYDSARYGAGNTVLAEDLTDVETAADVTATGDTWATTASHPSLFPAGGGPGINVDIGGLTYSCTAITGSSPNYTLTLVRLGTDKIHSSGSPVRVTDAAIPGL